MPGSQRKSILRRVLSALAILALGVLLLELTLQALVVGRLVLYGKERSGGEGGGKESPVLVCAGDSYTYGMGASDGEHSYPGQLQSLLRETTGEPWVVKTAAFPGYDTGQALRALEGRFREGRVDLVVFCAGINDYHNLPEALSPEELREASAAENPGGYRFEFRTLKLLRLLRHEGAFRDDERPEVEIPEWFFERDREGRVETAWGWFWTKKLDQAEAAFSTLGEESLWVKRVAQIALAGQRGRREEHDRMLDELWEDLQGEGLEEVPDHDAGAVLMVFRRIADRRGNELVERIQPLYPENHHVQYESMLLHLFVRDLKAARAASDRTVEIDPSPGPDSYKWYARSQIYRQLGDASVAAEAAANAYLASHNPEEPRGIIQSADGLITQGIWARMLAGRDDLSPEDREVLERVGREEAAPNGTPPPPISPATQEKESEQPVRPTGPVAPPVHPEAQSSGGPVEQVLAKHYRLAVDRSREAGARILLAGYPVFKSEILAEMKQASADRQVPFTNTLDSIDAELARGTPWADLFIGDGHCNDRGYRLVAEHVLEALKANGMLESR